MTFLRTLLGLCVVSVLGFNSSAQVESKQQQVLKQDASVSTIEDYNALLPVWGISWAPGAKSINGYYQSFYTGFVMRQQLPERIHVRVGRGNATRVSVILDDQTLSDYLFDLAKRDAVYARMTGKGAPLDIKPASSKFLPQLSYFQQIRRSPAYGILAFVEKANGGAAGKEEIYAKSLDVLSKLNPGRVFNLKLDLNREFADWKASMKALSGGNAAKITGSAAHTMTAINTLVWGRINYTSKPSAEVIAKLTTALNAALNDAADFNNAAVELFKAVTGEKYAFKTLVNGQWQPAFRCVDGRCTLTYPEFTAIYPTGSIEAFTSDEFGNRINSYATPGLWQFLSRSGKHEIDNIRNEPYYGWIPKMDYEGEGNGFHNPAVRFWEPSRALRTAFGIPDGHNTLWAVKRGGVSHGCLRLPTASVWELRYILPVENNRATQVKMFGNLPQDFDLFDINGDGTREIMGVEYLISYGLQGAGDAARREGQGMEVNAGKKREFYTSLYGAKNIFRVTADGKYIFTNPRVSLQSYLDFQKHSVASRVSLPGEYELFEQRYEQDKVQLYSIGSTMTPAAKNIVRLMGRVRGCAPSSDKKACGEAAFDAEMKGLVK